MSRLPLTRSPLTRSPLTRLPLTVAAAALAATALLPAAAAPAAAAPAAGGTSGTTTGAAAPTATQPRTVTLLTGDRVAVAPGPGGRPEVTIHPAKRPDGTPVSFQVHAVGSHLYVIPQDAAGYVGAPLDLSLFDVRALVAAGRTDTDRPLRLAVTYRDGARRQALPGMRHDGTATLVQDPDSAGRFGQALAEHRPALFAGIRRIALPGAKPPGAANHSGSDGTANYDTANHTASGNPPPRWALHTLKVKVLDRLGRPAAGTLVDVMNADNVEDYLADQALFQGRAAFSVPTGSYEVVAYVPTQEADGTVSFTLVTDPEVRVGHDTMVVLRAAAGRPVGAHTPDPTTPVTAQLSLQRNPATGVSFTTTFVTFGPTRLYATPTERVRIGDLYFYPSARLGDGNGGVDDYVYDLSFNYTGRIPRELDPTLTRDQLATLHTRYHSPVPGRAESDARAGVLPWQAVVNFAGSGFAAPLERTEYVLPAPQLTFRHDVILDSADFLGFMSDNARTYSPGEQQTVDWAAQPMVPGIQQQTAPGMVQACPACRIGDQLSLMLFPHTDAAGHIELPDPTTATSLSLYQGDTLLGQVRSGFALLPMNPEPASYRLVADVNRQTPWWPTSTATHTEWTFDSAQRAPDPLPPGWTCSGKAGGGGGGGKGGGGKGGGAPADGDGCSFEPLLFLSYQTNAGTDDVVPAGSQAEVTVSVWHQLGAAPTPIDTLTAQVSFDDGATWQDVTATAGDGGTYTLTYDQPALDQTTGFASLRVTAADAAGSTVEQTVTRAYPLAVTPPQEGGGSPGGGSGDDPQPACAAPVAPPYAQCMAVVNPSAGGLDETGTPQGYGPSDLLDAYNLPTDAGAGKVVAIVDAFDDPSAEADLAAYRAQYGLPPCTTENGCFRKVNQRGDPDDLPVPDPGWGLEISLDLDAVSAACPLCDILLVEGDSPNVDDLGQGVDTAVALGADVVSNSYGTTGEFSGEWLFEQHYRHRDVPIVVATGDYGYGNGHVLIGGISFPAASPYVTAVGGTSLAPADSERGWTESVWAGATSGCSAYRPKPGWQRDRLCGMRTIADVSAVADPETGLAVYDTFGWGGWLVVGGTSAATPIVASVYALADHNQRGRGANQLYRAPASAFFDVTSGANGDNCAGTYLCNGVAGYDGPTGLGTPNGVTAFR